jgi:two-component system nitrate/nitrite response regulator NarL
MSSRSSTRALRVHLVERSALRRHGLRTWLQAGRIEVVGESADLGAAAADAARPPPDIVIAGAPGPGVSLDELLAQLRGLPPGTDALLLLDAGQGADALRALAAGVSVHILVPGSEKLLIQAAAGAKHGVSVIATAVLRDWVGSLAEPGRLGAYGRAHSRHADDLGAFHLTERELQVLREIADGADNSTIAERLVISENTVKTHVHSILRKLAVENRIQAAVYGVRVGLIDRREGGSSPHRLGAI